MSAALDNLKEALSLGLELSGLIFFSYAIHKGVASHFQWDDNLTLTGLISLSLILWTFHAYLYIEKRK